MDDGAAGEVEGAATGQPPAGENTQWATGVYTISAHSPTNQNHAENFMRSAMAPVTSAGVITANISWNAENDSGGIGTCPKPVAGTMLA